MTPDFHEPTAQPARSAPGSAAARRWWVWPVALCVLAIIAYASFPRRGGSGGATAAVAHQGIPVTAVRAARGNLDINLSALGSVTAFNSVTVKSRVDGQLMRVAFQEG